MASREGNLIFAKMDTLRSWQLIIKKKYVTLFYPMCRDNCNKMEHAGVPTDTGLKITRILTKDADQ
jgi:CO dehydrogenase/acetyl-CoA synthase alpha subunit